MSHKKESPEEQPQTEEKPLKEEKPPKEEKVTCEDGARFVIVKKGDTLWKIAKREGVTLEALIAANPQIEDPDLIFPGQKVYIPDHVKPKPPKPDPTTRIYIVQKGDTLFKIAKHFNVSLDTLIKANPQIKDPDEIFPGQKILIPQR